MRTETLLHLEYRVVCISSHYSLEQFILAQKIYSRKIGNFWYSKAELKFWNLGLHSGQHRENPSVQSWTFRYSTTELKVQPEIRAPSLLWIIIDQQRDRNNPLLVYTLREHHELLCSYCTVVTCLGRCRVVGNFVQFFNFELLSDTFHEFRYFLGPAMILAWYSARIDPCFSLLLSMVIILVTYQHFYFRWIRKHWNDGYCGHRNRY